MSFAAVDAVGIGVSAPSGETTLLSELLLGGGGDSSVPLGENVARSSGSGGSGPCGVWEPDGSGAMSAGRGEVGSDAAGETTVLDETCWWRGTLADMDLISSKP